MHGKILSGGGEISSSRPRGRQMEKIPKGMIPHALFRLGREPKCVPIGPFSWGVLLKNL